MEEILGRQAGSRIRQLRKAKGWTQVQLARKLGLKQTTISQMEGPEANLTLKTLERVARALGCKIQDLVG